MRRIALVMGLVAGSLWVVPRTASAGGFCQEPGSATEGEGKTVTMGKNCYTPTVLRTAPGTTVSFLNKDPEPHTVTSAGGAWGDPHREVAPGEVMTVEFEQPGVYAYTCLFHPGMSGTVVVGDSAALGSGATLIDVSELPPTKTVTRTVEDQGNGASTAVAISVASAVVAAGIGYVFGRRRRSLAPLPAQARLS